MDTPYLFVSYSRIQFYFVESLAHELDKSHVPYWFDVERLEMGKDWQSGIDNGLANCQALVLIVSQASIASSNVRYEWETAQKANKPVYLAVFEAVEIPPELQNAPAIDFRSNFKRGVRQLAQLFQSTFTQPAVQSDASSRHIWSVPRPNRYKLPFRLPLSVRIVFLTLLFASLCGFVGAAVAASGSLSLALMFLLAGIGYTYYGWRFSKRQYIHADIWYAILLATILSLGGVLIVFVQPAGNSSLPAWTNLLTLLSSVLLVGSLLSGLALIYSSAIFRWSPLGQAPQRLRQRALQIRRRRKIKFTPLQKTYSLTFASADKRLAGQVRQTMKKTHYAEVEDEAAADHNLVLLSNITPLALLESQSDELKKPVSIVACSIRSATSDEQALRSVTRFQWVDYRSGKPDALTDMAEILWLEDSDQPVSQKDYHVVPESFRNPVVPRSVFFVVNITRFLAALFGGTALLSIVGMVFSIQYLHTSAASSPTEVLFALAQIVLSVFLLWLCVGIMQRSVNFAASFVGLVGVALLTVILPALAFISLVPPPILPSGMDIFFADYIRDQYWINVAGFLLPGFLFTLGYAINLRGLYRWLPLSGESIRRKALPTLQQPFAPKLWRTNGIFVAVLLAGVMTLNQAGVNLLSANAAKPVAVTIDHLQMMLPQSAASMPVPNGDTNMITNRPNWLSQTFFTLANQIAREFTAYGPLVWLGAYQPDQASPGVIFLFVWRFEPPPGAPGFLVPGHPEMEIDRAAQIVASSTDPKKVTRTSQTNPDAQLDILTNETAVQTEVYTEWRVAIRGKQASYILYVFGLKDHVGKSQPMLNRLLSSLGVVDRVGQ